MKEAIFTRELKEAFEYLYPKAYVYKIPDTPRFPDNTGFRFIPKKPFDMFVLLDVFIAIENKQKKNLSAFAFDDVKDHQLTALIKTKNAGHKAFIIVNYRTDDYNKAFILDVNYFWHLKTVKFADRKSLPINFLLTSCPSINREKINNKTVWDVRLLETLN